MFSSKCCNRQSVAGVAQAEATALWYSGVFNRIVQDVSEGIGDEKSRPGDGPARMVEVGVVDYSVQPWR